MKDITVLIPSSLFRSELTPSQFAVLAYMIHGSSGNKFSGSVTDLAKACGCSRRQAQHCITALTKKGLVAMVHEDRGRVNTYIVPGGKL